MNSSVPISSFRRRRRKSRTAKLDRVLSKLAEKLAMAVLTAGSLSLRIRWRGGRDPMQVAPSQHADHAFERPGHRRIVMDERQTQIAGTRIVPARILGAEIDSGHGFDPGVAPEAQA